MAELAQSQTEQSVSGAEQDFAGPGIAQLQALYRGNRMFVGVWNIREIGAEENLASLANHPKLINPIRRESGQFIHKISEGHSGIQVHVFALIRQVQRLSTAYMPYKYRAHRYITDVAAAGVTGYRRGPFWLNWWEYIDIA